MHLSFCVCVDQAMPISRLRFKSCAVTPGLVGNMNLIVSTPKLEDGKSAQITGCLKIVVQRLVLRPKAQIDGSQTARVGYREPLESARSGMSLLSARLSRTSVGSYSLDYAPFIPRPPSSSVRSSTLTFQQPVHIEFMYACLFVFAQPSIRAGGGRTGSASAVAGVMITPPSPSVLSLQGPSPRTSVYATPEVSYTRQPIPTLPYDMEVIS